MGKSKPIKQPKPIDLQIETIKPDEPQKGWKQVDILITLNELKGIISGKEDEIWRRASRYNACLLSTKTKDGHYEARKDLTHVRLLSGLTVTKKYAVCEIHGIYVVKFTDSDPTPKGIKPGSTAFSIVIRQVVDHNLK